MKQQKMKVVSNVAVNESTYELVLTTDQLNMRAGQFVEVQLDGFSLRRPFSVARCNAPYLTLLYKVVGRGTDFMRGIEKGEELDVLTELGNTFNLEKSKKPLLIGGGIGCAPLLQLAAEFRNRGVRPTLLLCFRNKAEAFCLSEFSKFGEVIIATDDGSLGEKGNAVEVLKRLSDSTNNNRNNDDLNCEKATQNQCEKATQNSRCNEGKQTLFRPDLIANDNKVHDLQFDFYYACGPLIMLKNLAKYSTNGELSLEARMGCGFGACMGCSVKTTEGFKRVCKEGPVFSAGSVLFD